MTVDKIIIGAGLYGLYAAQKCGAAGQRVLVLERDPAPFMRATYINQARVHMGYHYPRSYSTAIKSAHYFQRFCRDYDFCLHTSFDQIYATSAHFSWTNAAEFRRFCAAAKIRCDDVAPERYFNNGMCDGAFLTTEYTYDAQVLKNWFLEQLAKLPNVQVLYSHKPDKIEKAGSVWRVTAGDTTVEAPFILNATYAGVNDIHAMLGLPPFKIKYEKCEIILCTVDERLKNTGITVMDGPFFSLMPFGQTGLHSLTSVTFTPHETSYDAVATFPCQQQSEGNAQHSKHHAENGIDAAVRFANGRFFFHRFFDGFFHYCCTSLDWVSFCWSTASTTTNRQNTTAFAWPMPFHWGPERA